MEKLTHDTYGPYINVTLGEIAKALNRIDERIAYLNNALDRIITLADGFSVNCYIVENKDQSEWLEKIAEELRIGRRDR